MGRRATDVNHLAFSVAKVLQKETGTLGQVPTVGCQPGGLRMHVWFKWIKLGLPAAGSKQSWDSHLKHSQLVQIAITCSSSAREKLTPKVKQNCQFVYCSLSVV